MCSGSASRGTLPRLDNDIIAITDEALGLRAHQAGRDKLALRVLKSKNIALWQIKCVLQGLQRVHKLLQLHVLVEQDVLHLS